MTEHDLKLTVVGCGTAAPQPDRVCSGYLIESRDLRLLMDCGAGVVLRMSQLGLSWQTITHLALTHYHTDHIGGVSMLFFALRWGMRPARAEPLVVIGPVGTRDLIARLGEAYGEHLLDPWFPLEIHEIEPGTSYALGARLTLSAARARHTPEALAYRLDADEPVFGFTGDTGEEPALADFMRGVRVLLSECSLPDEEEMHLHLTPRTTAQLATAANAGHLVATHVYPQLDRAALPGLLEEAGWSGRTTVASDGLSIEL